MLVEDELTSTHIGTLPMPKHDVRKNVPRHPKPRESVFDDYAGALERNDSFALALEAGVVAVFALEQVENAGKS